MLPRAEIGELFGEIDIYLFDQLARGRFDTRRRVLDVGCGDGRNLHYLLRRGYDCHGLDRSRASVDRLLAAAREVEPSAPPDRFVVGEADALPWEDGRFDVVISSAVLHFAEDTPHFGRMVSEAWRVLAAGGLFFARLASVTGLDGFADAAGRRTRLPDGSDRYVVSDAVLLHWTERLGARLADPIKTTNVQGARCMTTWCLFKQP